MSHHGFCIWLTGLPSAGKTTIAKALTPKLKARGWNVELLDGDEVRTGLSADLGFDRKSREMHAARVTFVSKVLARNGVIPIVALISPYATSRSRARTDIGAFVEVYVTTPLNVCEERDVKGLYKKARAGLIHEMTGIDDPYEAPEHPEIIVETVDRSPDDAAEYILRELERLKWLAPTKEPAAASPVSHAPSAPRATGVTGNA
ncbi:MAG: adenylyl-sulfate kinase [Thermoplasmata archaeon]|nr:adenylyl-sulfate kinase [Thermoplasmata archaeon]